LIGHDIQEALRMPPKIPATSPGRRFRQWGKGTLGKRQRYAPEIGGFTAN